MKKILNIALFITLSLFSKIVFSNNNVIRIPLHAAHITLDPSGVQDTSSLFVSRQVNCQLIRSYGSVTVLEAADFIHFETPTKISIHIKSSATFQDGSKITSYDVVASFKHIKKTRRVLRNVFTWISNIQIVNQNKIIITLKKPVPQFLKVFSSPNYAIFKKSFLIAADKDPSLWNNPMGCGNYRVIEHTNEVVKLDPIKEGRSIEFYLNSKDQLDPNEIDKYDINDLHLTGNSKKISEFNKIEVFDPTQIYLGLNTKSKHWRNKKDRCDFISKLDSQPILKAYGDAAKPATDILPEGILGYQPFNNIKNNLGADKKFQNGHKIHDFCLSYLTVSIPENYRALYLQMIQKIYPSVTTISITNNKHFGSDFVKTECDALVLGLKSNTLDGYDILAVFSEEAPNFTGFSNNKVSTEIEDSQNEADPTIRASIYQHIVSQLKGECLVYPILTLPVKTIYVRKSLNAPNIGKGPLNEYYLGKIK